MAIAISLAVIAAAGLVVWAYQMGASGEAARWRQRIAEATQQLNADVAKEGAGIVASDEELVAKLTEKERAKGAAQARLADAQKAARDRPSGKCPRIPAECLRQ